MSHILIGIADALPAPEVVFSLRAAGHEVSAFAWSDDIPLSALPLTALHVIPAPEMDFFAAMDSLQTLMSSPNAPDLLMPIDDLRLWLCDAAFTDAPRIAGARGALPHPRNFYNYDPAFRGFFLRDAYRTLLQSPAARPKRALRHMTVTRPA